MRIAKARKDRRFNLHEGCKPTLEISNDIIIIIIILITTIIIALRLSWSETFDLLWLVHILVLEARPPAYPLRPPTPRDVALFPLSDRWQQQHSPPLVSLIAALRDVWHLLRARTSCHHSAKYKRGISPFSAETTRCYFRVHFFSSGIGFFLCIISLLVPWDIYRCCHDLIEPKEPFVRLGGNLQCKWWPVRGWLLLIRQAPSLQLSYCFNVNCSDVKWIIASVLVLITLWRNCYLFLLLPLRTTNDNCEFPCLCFCFSNFITWI